MSYPPRSRRAHIKTNGCRTAPAERLESRVLLSAALFAIKNANDTIGEYTTSGAVVNAALFTGAHSFAELAVSGSDLFVTNTGDSTIGEYTTAGATVNTDLISGLVEPQGIAVSGSDLFVCNQDNTKIGEYTTSGATVNAALVTGLNNPDGIAISGSDLFVVNGGIGTIGEYTTSGATVNATLISGITGAHRIAISGSDLFITSNSGNTIGEYTTSGATVNASLITGLSSPLGITLFGSDLFVTNTGNDTIGEYTTSGATVNASLITGFSASDIAVAANVLTNQLAFAQQPVSTTTTAALGPITVDVEDSTGNLLTTDNSNVTLAIASGTAGATLGGTTTVAAVNGVATFSDLSIAVAGTYTLTATDVGDMPATSAGFQITPSQTEDLFVANHNSNTVGEYTASGASVNPSLITGLSGPTGLAVSGQDLFVANDTTGTIGEYTLSGAAVNASLISGLSEPRDIAISGSDLFVTNATGSVGEYATSGATVNSALIAGLGNGNPNGIAVSGSDLFVANFNAGTIGEYTTSGAAINVALITGLNTPVAITLAGSDLFVTSYDGASIGEYSTSGSMLNASLVTGVPAVQGIATDGSNLFVTENDANIVSESTTAGAAVNGALLNTGLASPWGIAVAGINTPDQLAFSQQLAGATTSATLGPITVDVDDSSGNLVTTDNSNVTLAVASGSAGATLGGTTTVAAVNGVATFPNLSISTVGSYTLTATDAGDTAATSNSFKIYLPPETVGGLDLSYGVNGLASHNVGFASTDGVAQDGAQSVIIGTIGAAPDESFGLTRYNADGSLDTSFGTGGVTASSFGTTDDVPAAVDVLATGQILVAGTATTYTGGVASGSEFAVAEYNADGSLDTSFGGGSGQVLVSFSAISAALSNDVLRAMVVDSGGVIYLAGSSDAGGNSGTDFAVAALNTTGAADTGFGTGGKVLTDFAGGDDAANSLALQANGDLVAAGSATLGGATEIALARYLPSGVLDKHFGTKGLVTTNVRSVYDSASSVAIQSKGQIVVGGLSATGSGSSLNSDFVLARYTSAGKLDRTFGNAGTVITSFGQPSAVTQLVLQGNGQIIASGKTTPSLSSLAPSELDLAVARYTIRGALDTAFDGTGKAIVDLSTGMIGTSGLRTVAFADVRIAPLDASSLGTEFAQFTSSQQGAVSVTPGGELLDAGNSGANTVEAEIITAGVDLVTSLLTAVPASVTGGMKGTVSVQIAEGGTSQATGTVTIELEVAADAQGDGATPVKSLVEKINLRDRQSHTYRIAFVYPEGLSAGNYYLLADVENGPAPSLKDLNAQNNLSASKSAVDIAPPFISLDGSALSAGSPFTPGKTAKVIFTVANDGNVLAKGTTTADLILSTDQTAVDGITVADSKLSVGLAAGKSRVYRVSFLLPKTFTAGTYYLIAVIDPAASLGSIDRTNSTVLDPTQLTVL